MAENVVRLPSQIEAAINHAYCLAEQTRALEAALEAERLRAARLFVVENGWRHVPEFLLEALAGRSLGALSAPTNPGPGCRVDCYADRRGRPSAVVLHTTGPRSRPAKRFLDRAELLGLWVHPLPYDSWAWPGESVGQLITPTP